MAYEYHGTSDLIALPNTSQRIVDGSIIVIEKDYAIRRDRLPNALESLAPGQKMPGTNYIIDTPADIQLGNDGFARIRLSGLDIDLAADSVNIEQRNIGIGQDILSGIFANVVFTYAIGTFSYKRSIFSESQDPDFPDLISPILLQGGFNPSYSENITFGESKWIGISVNKTNLYENKVFQYTVIAICAPSSVTISSPQVTVGYNLYIGGSPAPGKMAFPIGYGARYEGPISLFGPLVSEAQRIALIQSELDKAEEAFESAWRMNGTGMNIVADKQYSQALRNRINRLRAQLGQ